MIKILSAAAAVLTLGTATAQADDTATCTGFSWSMEQEQKLFADPGAAIASGTTLAATPATAMRLSLQPHAQISYPTPPQRTAKNANANGGWIVFPAPAQPGLYQVTMSTRGWIDAVQSGTTLPNEGFSSDATCKPMHKSIRFNFAASPVTIQVSDVTEAEVVLTVVPVGAQ